MIEQTLLEMCQYGNYDTDKFLESKIGFTRTWYWNRHCYVDEVYTHQFERIRHQATNVLEIGVDLGGSILLWKDYFPNAHITGVDIKKCEAIENKDRITSIVTDAYTKEFADTLADNSYDLIIDDGPHTLASMIAFLRMYLPLLKDDGILVIEDVQDISWIDNLREMTDEPWKPFIEVYDRRSVKGRYDDIMFVINKTRQLV